MSAPVAVPRAKRLESWKEIAGYLSVTVRTAQRWEAEEKLPVHRNLHAQKGFVSAWADELDAWMAGRSRHHPKAVSAKPTFWSRVKEAVARLRQ